MAWFDDLDLPGSTITGYFGWVTEDSADEDDLPDVASASGTVTFTPTADAVRVDGAWVGIRPVTAQIMNGELSMGEDELPVRVLSTDADTGVEGWGWTAKFSIPGAKLPAVSFLAPAEGVHLTGGLVPITGAPVEIIGADAMDRLVTAEDLIAQQEVRLSSVEATVDRIKLANTSTGEGPPTGTAPVGWRYIDLATGDHYRMEA